MLAHFQAPFRMGIDIGGTFTDLVVTDRQGLVLAHKAPTTPTEPTNGVVDAIEGAARVLGLSAENLLASCELLVHGSTIATNTLLEHKGARVGLLTTAGFRDTLEIRRGLRKDPWNHREPFPPPLVPRRLRRGVVERTDSSGNVIVPLDETSLRQALAVFRREGVEAVAICFLNSYRNPANEQACRAWLQREWPEAWVSCSSDIAPILGEYERSATVVANAYVGPRIAPYLQSLELRLESMGLRRPLLIVQSNGGALRVAEIAPQAVQMVLSGPAAGVGAMRHYGGDSRSSSLVAIEVGGTSCDVTLMRDGVVQTAEQLDVEGYCIAVPSVEIHTIGAGGGTIARVDPGGMLQAGPEGAGARPGPAAYGLGGDKPTVTDAQLVLGRLAPGPYAGGAISLDLDRAHQAIDVHLARPLGITVEEAAIGILRVVEQSIQHAVERVSIERGYDLRDFTLVAAGGAGPLHGPAVGKALGCAAVYVPRLAGVFCAVGMCNADVRIDRIQSWHGALAGPSVDGLGEALGTLEQHALQALERQGFSRSEIHIEHCLSLRYVGQQWPVQVNCSDTLAPRVLREAFEAAHQRLYGHFTPGAEIEITGIKVTTSARLAATETERQEVPDRPAPSPGIKRRAWLNPSAGWSEIPVHDGADLSPGHRIEGPAIIAEATTTLLVEPGQALRVTAAGNYMITPVDAEKRK